VPPVTRSPRPPARRRGRSRRGFLVFGALLLAGAGVAAAFVWPFDNRGGPAGETSAVAAAPLSIAAVDDFDPGGDGEEHSEETSNVFDGDATTSWSSETYATEAFGNGKSGVGLVIDLGSEQSVTAVAVSAAESGWSGAVYVASTPGDSVADWGEPAAGPTPVTTPEAEFHLTSPTAGRYVLVWFTDLPSSRRMDVDEVTVEGPG
jgi:hypothetical protein